MKHLLISLLTLIAGCFMTAHSADVVYVIPIDDEIGSTTWRHTQRGLEEAAAMNADLVLLHLNTYGGTLVHADSIRTALMHCNIPTVAFVDNNAASAGALIALACDTVYMRPDASMGAATVVNGNDGTAMPDKYQSYMRAMMRATAERHGKIFRDGEYRWRRDPLIAEAMVDPRVKVPGLIDDTKVLTFTPDEAIKWGYADGKAESVSEVLSRLGVEHYRIEQFRPTWVDNLLGFFTNPAVQAFLIMIIVGGIYFELQTPGMGFPSVAAITAAALYFLPLYLTGIASSWLILVFLAGVLLILIEIFVIPGFGVTGIAGGCLALGAVFIGLLENFSFDTGDIDLSVIWHSIATIAAGIALSVVAILYLTSRYAPKFVRRSSELHLSQKVEDGYIGVDMSVAKHVGDTGVTVTDLHPGGKIRIGDEEFDAVSVRGFVEEGRPVKVLRYENAQLYVTEI